MNPAAVVAWNIDKRYLRTLQSRGVPVVPTEWVVDADSWLPPPQEFVVKPAISAGGRQTARYRPDQAEAATAHVRRLCGGGHTVIVQPYVTSVDSDGEAKLVFVDGELSHAVRVGPLFAPGDGVTERPWEKPVTMDPMRPTPAQLRAADHVLSALHAELGQPLLYARVDLVTGPNGQPLLGEVELVDPSLLRIVPPSAARLAAAIAARAERCAAQR